MPFRAAFSKSLYLCPRRIPNVMITNQPIYRASWIGKSSFAVNENANSKNRPSETIT
ncbi:Uncharacterised protein [Vibrio cholerae]|nr:Uncharacterised protein [Vibrio cholerae]